MLLDAEHHAWLQSNWNGETSRREKNRLYGGLKKKFKLSGVEALEAVQVFLKDPTQSDQIDVVSILKEESERRKTRMVNMQWCFGILITLIVSWAVFCIATGRELEIAGFGGSFAAMGAMWAVTGRHKMAARAAAKLRDKQAFGPLVELFSSDDKDIKEVAAEAVQNLLPLLEQEDFDSMNPAHRTQLLGALHSTKKLDFAAAVLGAASRHGDAHYISSLESFADGKSALPKHEKERAKSLARMSLADIRMRVAKEKIDERIQELGGTLTDYTTRVLGDDGEELNVRS